MATKPVKEYPTEECYTDAQFSHYVGGGGSDEERRLLEAHLLECAYCRAKSKLYK